jgi:MOSC domain-containing protein YiiM
VVVGIVPTEPETLAGSDTLDVSGSVLAVCRHGLHTFSKQSVDRIQLVEGLGVHGDSHASTTVQHRSRVRQDPSQPNLRQVHLIHSELIEELAGAGYTVRPGDLGENVTTAGVDLLGLPKDTLLHLGRTAVVRVTGLRNPCQQINDFADGLLKQVLMTGPDGEVVRKAGIMGVVERGGMVYPDDPIHVELPPGEHRRLERV